MIEIKVVKRTTNGVDRDMATSSIIENIRVNNPKALEEYIDHMEKSAKNYHPRTEAEASGVVTDRAKVKEIAEKSIEAKRIANKLIYLLSFYMGEDF